MRLLVPFVFSLLQLEAKFTKRLPAVCDDNEVFLKAAPCSDNHCTWIGLPPQPCVRRNICSCQPGYARDTNNKCIREEDCPPDDEGRKCHFSNEIFKFGWAPLTEKSCDNQLMEGTGLKFNFCQCKDGYLRHNDGHCVREEECS